MTSEPERLPKMDTDTWNRENEMLALFTRCYRQPKKRKALWMLLSNLEAQKAAPCPRCNGSGIDPGGLRTAFDEPLKCLECMGRDE